MPDATDNRNRRRGDCTRERFVIEGPQILKRSPTARQEQHVTSAARAGQGKCRDDLARRLGALYGHRINQNRDRREAARQDMQDVADRGTGRRGNNANSPWQPGQRAFSGQVEQALGGQFGEQLLVLTAQGAKARILDMIDDQLELAARLIQPDARPHQHFLAVTRHQRREHIALPEHRTAHLRGGILEREIPVA